MLIVLYMAALHCGCALALDAMCLVTCKSEAEPHMGPAYPPAIGVSIIK